jgi:hypothetical protein
MTLQDKLASKKRQRKLLDAEIKYIEAQIEIKQAAPKAEKSLTTNTNA